jgi:hypothetical protein
MSNYLEFSREAWLDPGESALLYAFPPVGFKGRKLIIFDPGPLAFLDLWVGAQCTNLHQCEIPAAAFGNGSAIELVLPETTEGVRIALQIKNVSGQPAPVRARLYTSQK